MRGGAASAIYVLGFTITRQRSQISTRFPVSLSIVNVSRRGSPHLGHDAGNGAGAAGTRGSEPTGPGGETQ